MSNTTVGTCGRCGGRVSVPSVWLGIYPPTPTCERCGAIQKNAHGPTLDMDPPPKITVDHKTRSAAERAAGGEG